MTVEIVMDIARETLWIIITSSAPLLLISLVVGLVISIFQTITSIQEQTLTFVPKILAVFGGWILNNIVGFMERLWSSFGEFVI